MKRILTVVLLLSVVFISAPTQSAYASCGNGPLDKAWDWATTLGKEGFEKQQILAENKAERMKKCAAREAKKMKKGADKAGKDMKKKLGL